MDFDLSLTAKKSAGTFDEILGSMQDVQVRESNVPLHREDPFQKHPEADF
jgi:hypothetical protein